MKATGVFVFLCLLAGSLWGYAELPTWESKYLKGRVYKLEEGSREFIFNQAGKVILERDRFLGKIFETVYTYDDQGRIRHKIVADNENNIYEEDHFLYDERGRLYEKIDGDSTLSRITKVEYKYDAKNRLQWERVVDDIGGMFIANEYQWDKKGRKIRQNRYDMNMKLESYYLFKYDKKGNILEESIYDAPKTLALRTVRKYDKQSRLIYEARYRGKVLEEVVEAIFDEQDNAVLSFLHKPQSKETTTISHQFTYDDQGNWIVDVTFIDGDSWGPETRKIYYFED